MGNFFKTLFSDKSFWAALASIIACICVAANVPSGSVAQVTSFIGGLGTIITYIINNSIQVAAQTKAEASVKSAQLQLDVARAKKGE